MQVKTLHLWTNGDPRVGIAGETAEVSAPGWLISADEYDAESFKAQLEAFRAKVIEAFSVIWDAPPYVLYDFELAEENAAPPVHQPT